MLDVTILGTAGYMPLPDRHLSSCALRTEGRVFLIDAGEGTQLALRKAHIPMKRIERILLTHCHADHTAGLPGLLLTMGNEGRTDKVTICGPRGTLRLLEAVRVIAQDISFPVEVREWADGGEEADMPPFRVAAFPCDHGMPCFGYRFDIARCGEFLPEKARENDVPLQVWSVLQKKKCAQYHGVTYTSDQVLGPERKGLRVLFATDTRPVDDMVRLGRDADLMILEGMYGDREKLPGAIDKHHMLSFEAARVAKEAGAGKLVLTHYSPALEDPADAERIAREIFPQTYAGHDADTWVLRFAPREGEETCVLRAADKAAPADGSNQDTEDGSIQNDHTGH